MKHVVLASLIALPAVAQAQTAPAPAPAPAAGATAPAPAAAGAAPTVGATVTGKDNAPVGTIAQVSAQAVVIDTGTNKVPVPPASIGTSPKGPTIAMTKAELDAAFQQAAGQAQADLSSKLVAGTMVHGTDNSMLGTIKSADAQYVTVTTKKGDVKLPVNGFGAGPNNTVVLGMTAAQLDAATAGAAPAPAASSAAPK